MEFIVFSRMYGRSQKRSVLSAKLFLQSFEMFNTIAFYTKRVYICVYMEIAKDKK